MAFCCFVAPRFTETYIGCLFCFKAVYCKHLNVSAMAFVLPACAVNLNQIVNSELWAVQWRRWMSKYILSCEELWGWDANS